MKKLLFAFLFLSLTLSGLSQSFYSGSSTRANLKRLPPSTLGVIWDETAWASLTNYSNVGAGISVSGGQLNMTGGTATFNDYLLLTGSTNFNQTSCEKWTISVRAIAPAIDVGSYGIGLGVRCTNNFAPMNAIFRWGWDTGAPAGIFMYPNNSLTSQLSTGVKTNPTSGQTVWFDVSRNKNVYTVTGYQSDHTTVMITGSFTMSLTTGATNQANNTGQWVLENFGGTNIKVLEWKITIDANKNVDYVFIGDSNMYGMFAGSNSARFAEAAATAKGKSFEILAGIGDRTGDMINRIAEARALNPKYVIISAGRNDVANSIVIGTIQTNINTIAATLKGYGIVVRSGGVIASNVDVSAVQTSWNGLPLLGVNTYTTTKSATTTLNVTYDSGDAIHLNPTGNGVVSTLWQTIIY